MYLAHQVYHGGSGGLFNAYLEATRRHHGYLILDLTLDMNDSLRFRTNIFSTEYPPVVYSDIGDEAFEIQLSRPSRAQNSSTEIA